MADEFGLAGQAVAAEIRQLTPAPKPPILGLARLKCLSVLAPAVNLAMASALFLPRRNLRRVPMMCHQPRGKS
jgi:hypothetical protein